MNTSYTLDLAGIRAQIEASGIPITTLAARLDVSIPHLYRVMNGRRHGSPQLLRSLADIIETIPRKQDDRRSQDIQRLFNAAVHTFFLSRGDFESEICGTVAERRQEALAAKGHRN